MCQFVSMAVKLINIQSQNLAQGLTLMTSWTSFDGQGHRSKVKVIQLENIIFEFWPGFSVL